MNPTTALRYNMQETIENWFGSYSLEIKKMNSLSLTNASRTLLFMPVSRYRQQHVATILETAHKEACKKDSLAWAEKTAKEITKDAFGFLSDTEINETL